MPLRPYQETGIKLITQAWREGHKAIIAVGPVGMGKTALAIEMTARAFRHDASISDPEKQFDVFFIAHRQELISQPYQRYTKEGMRAGIIKAGHKPNPSARLQIVSVQTVVNRVILPTIRKRALVFVDECHRVKSASYTQVIENLKKTYVEVFLIGLTATPYRGDHQGLGDVATKLIEIATPKQLVSEGWICNPISYVGENDAPSDVTLPTSHGEFNTDASAALSDRPHLVANIVDMWRKYSGGYPGWGFAVNVAHSQHIVERFNAAGIRAAHLDGSTPPRERKRILARSSIGGFASNHPDGLDVVCNVDVLTEGTDPDSCYEILLEDPEVRDLWQGKSYPPEQNPIAVIGDWARTKSMGKYIQRIGRACRTHPKKTHAVYLDHAGNEARHCQLLQHEGFTLDDGSNVVKSRLIKKATKAQTLNCPVCGMAFKPPLANCADCGSALGVVGNVDLEALAEAPGELVPSVAQPNLPRKQLPHEQEAWLRARLVWWESENAGRVARGLAAYKRGHFYHTANAAFLAKFKRPMDVGVFEKVMGR
jgi:superfamily II DNA or RNA helicase